MNTPETMFPSSGSHDSLDFPEAKFRVARRPARDRCVFLVLVPIEWPGDWASIKVPDLLSPANERANGTLLESPLKPRINLSYSLLTQRSVHSRRNARSGSFGPREVREYNLR